MTNKMPVVGEKYKKKDFPNSIYECVDIRTERTPNGKSIARLKALFGNYAGKIFDYNLRAHFFDEHFEELPHSNSQKPEEVQVNEVDRALEELKNYLRGDSAAVKLQIGKNKGEASHANAREEVIAELAELAQNLVNALEAEEAKKKRARKNPPYCVKGDEQEVVGWQPTDKPFVMKAIWKDVGELPENNESVILQDRYDNNRFFGFFTKKNGFTTLAFPDCGANWANKYCTLTDFINSFEQLQKDVEELKKK